MCISVENGFLSGWAAFELKRLAYKNQGKTLIFAVMHALDEPIEYDEPHVPLREAPAYLAGHSSWVSIRSLGANHRNRVLTHLRSLDSQDRMMRFGYVANDAQIEAYVDRLNFHHDAVFGVFNRRLEIVALAHLAICRLPGSEPVGDFGVSVLPAWRGRGIGGRLYERAALHARNEGVELLHIQALASNAPMLAIARKHGASVQRMGSESEACLRLPQPSLESRLQEILEEYWANIHYTAKSQMRAWTACLAVFQSIRERAISANSTCSP